MHLQPYIQMVSKAALCRLETLQNTYDLARRCLEEHIPGDFVECGVYAGAQPAMMWRACYDTKKFRQIHLYDSFEGIPIAGPNDRMQPGIGAIPEEEKTGELRSSGVSVCSLPAVQNHLRSWGVDLARTSFYPGWFQSTVPQAPMAKIALLRLDGDLYESTKVCLEHLYPKLSVGGFCVADDYQLPGCRDACQEYFDAQGLTPTVVEVPGGAGVAWWQKT
jgi:hypothetical protein